MIPPTKTKIITHVHTCTRAHVHTCTRTDVVFWTYQLETRFARINILQNVFFPSEAILHPVYILYVVVGNTPYGNGMSPEPNRCCCKLNVLRRSLSSSPSFLLRRQISWMQSTRKMPQKRKLKLSLRHLLVNLTRHNAHTWGTFLLGFFRNVL